MSSLEQWTYRIVTQTIYNSESQLEMDSLVNLARIVQTMRIIHTGEQIRQRLHAANLIKDRKYHLRTYKSCIVGHDLIEWLIKNKHCENREATLDALAILQKYSLFHHVCDDHDIKDQTLFYRFRRDDETYKEDKDLKLFYKALELYNGLITENNGVIRSYQQDGELFRNAFQGSDFVDYILKRGDVQTREDAVLLGRRLLESDTIRHVTDDFHFRDDSRILYRFTLDFNQKRYLKDVFNYAPAARNCSSRSNSGPREKSDYQFYTPNSTPVPSPKTNKRSTAGQDQSLHLSESTTPDEHGTLGPNDPCIQDNRGRSVSGDSGNSTDTSETMADFPKTKSVLLRHATVHELESPDTPYVKQSIKIMSDPVGYGFVIRGESPTYVQAVDPTGPAAVAGLKVRQFIYSVNGQCVVSSDHKTVGKFIMRNPARVTLVVMTHKRDAATR